MSDAVDRILGAGGHPTCSFVEMGRTYEGVILDDREVQAREFGTKNPKVWDDGSPVMVAVFDIQTEERDPEIEDDDGIRSLYVDKKGLRVAVADAFRASGMKRGDSASGGTIKVRLTGFGEATQGQANPPKVFQAKFTPAPKGAVSNVMDDENYDYGEEPF